MSDFTFGDVLLWPRHTHQIYLVIDGPKKRETGGRPPAIVTEWQLVLAQPDHPEFSSIYWDDCKAATRIERELTDAENEAIGLLLLGILRTREA